jgi:hypothetical protein
MRRVDNIVSVLDSALQRQVASFPQAKSQPPSQLPNSALPHQAGKGSKATPEELASTAEGQRLIDASTHSEQERRRHGRGPKQGDMLPERHSPSTASPANSRAANITLQTASKRPLGDVAREAGTIKLIERWKVEMPTEQEMLPKDKYTMFDRKAKGYRKGIHKLPKWTRLSQRLNPPGF